MGRKSLTAVVLLALVLMQLTLAFSEEPSPRRPRPKREKLQYTNVLKAKQLEEPGRSNGGVPGDWRAVDESGLTDAVRAHWISLQPDGRLIGRISTFLPDDPSMTDGSGIRVHFAQSGRVVTQLATDSAGRFETSAVSPGVYSVIAIGDRGFLAFSVIVLPSAVETPPTADAKSGNTQFVNLQPVEESLNIDALAVGPPHQTLLSILNRYFPEMTGAYVDEGDFHALAGGEQGAAAPLQSGMRGLMEAPPENTTPSSTISRQALRVGPNGKIIGRIIGIQKVTGRPILVRQANVFVLQNDRVLSRASTDERGVFEMVGIRPGTYGLVVADQEGFGAIGFEVVDADTTQAPRNADETYVALASAPGSDLSVGIITTPQDLSAVLSNRQRGGGGGGGGNSVSGATVGGGGGGAGGGGGEFGAIGAAAGFGALAGALSDDDQGFQFTPATK
jgi:uncharacterized membrane protein YgcG